MNNTDYKYTSSQFKRILSDLLNSIGVLITAKALHILQRLLKHSVKVKQSILSSNAQQSYNGIRHYYLEITIGQTIIHPHIYTTNVTCLFVCRDDYDTS